MKLRMKGYNDACWQQNLRASEFTDHSAESDIMKSVNLASFLDLAKN